MAHALGRTRPPKRSGVRLLFRGLTALAVALACASLGLADWPTHRGDAARTGCADERPGPKKPKVLWIHESQEHFLAAPVPGDKALYVSGLGAFNTSAFRALDYDPNAEKRLRWSKTAPFLKLPVVCAPAVADGKVIFGDGMHQTDGANLHCLTADTGLPLWRLPIDGKLVHLEGAPTVVDGKVYVGGGNAGVFCVDGSKLTLGGREVTPEEAAAAIEKAWKELLAKYEEEKKKDPDFAVPPNEDMLPRPSPKRLWQQGKDKWHVDAPVAVVGDRVLAASAFLDQEKVGERLLLCLDAKDGSVHWKTPLNQNPWSGPTVAGDLVLVGCSSIRFDTKEIAKAKGELLAIDLKTGDIKWRKDVPGGILGSVAVRGKLAVFTATDGKVRAWDIADGKEKWAYDAKAAFFAGPAVSADAVYAADLKGVVHAIQLDDGKQLWKLDLAADPVKAPGMVDGGPVLRKGRLYVATCNHEGEHQRKKTVVVCIGEDESAK